MQLKQASATGEKRVRERKRETYNSNSPEKTDVRRMRMVPTAFSFKLKAKNNMPSILNSTSYYFK
ncbi:hypothetical protein KY290_029560 [Solanum tuberosum]|uniref:Uncharacterized protein n=1 Tax=Solanum tuberosum TaxID=4113 RepID=A0ABQ7UMA8_SOLTU|nr:hypothetical protein KY289_028753 [Solanum tuberosum]KAH0750328.1 hypothetical protein KY290_029560 [Solanum tuberosum]